MTMAMGAFSEEAARPRGLFAEAGIGSDDISARGAFEHGKVGDLSIRYGHAFCHDRLVDKKACSKAEK